MKPPTARQLAIVAFWAHQTDESGYPPTLREVCSEFGFSSTNAASDHVNCCARKGLLRRTADRRGRGIIVTDLGRSLVGAPPQASPSHRHRHSRIEMRVRAELLPCWADAVFRVREGGLDG